MVGILNAGAATLPDTVSQPGASAFSTLLGRLAAGDREALDLLLPRVYDELHRLAHAQRRRGPADTTLDTTALVHEAYLRLTRAEAPAYLDRGHFMAVAARAMRQLLVDEARHHVRQKRGGGQILVPLGAFGPDGPAIADLTRDADLVLALDQALDRLEAIAPRLRQVVEHRFFAGLSEEETASSLAITERTVRRDWVKAKALLHRELAAAGAT